VNRKIPEPQKSRGKGRLVTSLVMCAVAVAAAGGFYFWNGAPGAPEANLSHEDAPVVPVEHTVREKAEGQETSDATDVAAATQPIVKPAPQPIVAPKPQRPAETNPRTRPASNESVQMEEVIPAPADNWPTGPNFNSAGKFRIWASQRGARNFDIEPLADVEDVKQIHITPANWVVLHNDGTLTSRVDMGVDATISRIATGHNFNFVLITEDGKPIPIFGVNERDIPEIPADHPPVEDAFLSPLYIVLLFKDGTVFTGGRGFDGVNEARNPEWAEVPALPEGVRATGLACSDQIIAFLCDDGQVRAWDRSGKLQIPPAMSEAPIIQLVGASEDLIANYGSAKPALSFRMSNASGRGFTLFGQESPGGRVLDTNHSGMLLQRSGELLPSIPMAKAFKEINEFIAKVRCATPDHVAFDWEQSSNGRGLGQFFWYESEESPAEDFPLEPGNSLTVSGVPEVMKLVAGYQNRKNERLKTLFRLYGDALDRKREGASEAQIQSLLHEKQKVAALVNSIQEHRPEVIWPPAPALPSLSGEQIDLLGELRNTLGEQINTIWTEETEQVSARLTELRAGLKSPDEQAAVDDLLTAFQAGKSVAPRVTSKEESAGIDGAQLPSSEWTQLPENEDLSDWNDRGNSIWEFDDGEFRKVEGPGHNLVKSLPYTEFILEGEFRATKEVKGSIKVERIGEMSLCGSEQGETNGQYCGSIFGYAGLNGVKILQDSSPSHDDRWTPFRLAMGAGSFTTWIEGEQIAKADVSAPDVNRELTLSKVGDNGELRFRNLRVREYDDSAILPASIDFREWLSSVQFRTNKNEVWTIDGSFLTILRANGTSRKFLVRLFPEERKFSFTYSKNWSEYTIFEPDLSFGRRYGVDGTPHREGDGKLLVEPRAE